VSWYDDWSVRDARRRAPKTTISVKLTPDELGKLDSLRKPLPYGSELEPRGDVLRRLLEQARKNHHASTARKTKASSA
jgi:hypothetical protein